MGSADWAALNIDDSFVGRPRRCDPDRNLGLHDRSWMTAPSLGTSPSRML